MVYAFVRDGRCLYIGMSRHGIGRAYDPGHHVLVDVKPEPGDRIAFWYCSSPEEAKELEKAMIREHVPAMNAKLYSVKERAKREKREKPIVIYVHHPGSRRRKISVRPLSSLVRQVGMKN